ncbi:MAG: RluA family pseudouridine synthase [Polyangiaceae bacterium]|nr:RluA family pseudouridine synthase [Polyangiaceae bacterium]
MQASRATVQRWMTEGRVIVDGRAAAPADKLAVGASVEVTPAAGPPSVAVPDASVVIDAVFEDETLLVIDKPAGLVVHPARGNWEGTLVHGLLARKGFEQAAFAEDADESEGSDPSVLLRPGIVHRLDKGTSGLLVVAKTADAREALKTQFSAHTIDREYVAIVVGEPHDATISAPHGRHPRDRLRFTSLGAPVAARRAVTHVHVLAQWAGAALVACRLETGRTHQIRVHLTERMKTPILGDPLYGRRPKDPAILAVGDELGRQALHARLLGFTHPRTGERMRFESPMPADMERAADALKRLPS